ncbi:uncharacterized protein BDR25DRAFT_304637 [Lindgomyces ingoldianus]|uniref:Uncharacterized protein n=1 Tax=Lindgomyces ingoldianus TaxID=673940 RepID=A0ACB6QQ39_9PLEO|nr:uncharacterized protein BDR25DRAFT_304637 [Lindgomyces ingoldianus]KAF2469108.1 hypothetical protein BDR25DRAFT_304637 [Lindgomyces ingoldianus]
MYKKLIMLLLTSIALAAPLPGNSDVVALGKRNDGVDIFHSLCLEDDEACGFKEKRTDSTGIVLPPCLDGEECWSQEGGAKGKRTDGVGIVLPPCLENDDENC